MFTVVPFWLLFLCSLSSLFEAINIFLFSFLYTFFFLNLEFSVFFLYYQFSHFLLDIHSFFYKVFFFLLFYLYLKILPNSSFTLIMFNRFNVKNTLYASQLLADSLWTNLRTKWASSHLSKTSSYSNKTTFYSIKHLPEEHCEVTDVRISWPRESVGTYRRAAPWAYSIHCWGFAIVLGVSYLPLLNKNRIFYHGVHYYKIYYNIFYNITLIATFGVYIVTILNGCSWENRVRARSCTDCSLCCQNWCPNSAK